MSAALSGADVENRLVRAVKGLPGSTKQFSAPNFTENYDMEAKVRSLPALLINSHPPILSCSKLEHGCCFAFS